MSVSFLLKGLQTQGMASYASRRSHLMYVFSLQDMGSMANQPILASGYSLLRLLLYDHYFSSDLVKASTSAKEPLIWSLQSMRTFRSPHLVLHRVPMNHKPVGLTSPRRCSPVLPAEEVRLYPRAPKQSLLVLLLILRTLLKLP